MGQHFGPGLALAEPPLPPQIPLDPAQAPRVARPRSGLGAAAGRRAHEGQHPCALPVVPGRARLGGHRPRGAGQERLEHRLRLLFLELLPTEAGVETRHEASLSHS